MGWTTTSRHVPAGREINFMMEETGVLKWSTLPECQRPRVVASARAGNALFFAVQTPAAYFAAGIGSLESWPYLPDADGSITGAVIVLIDRARGSFGWKDMCETSGPYVPAPAAFLNHLSALKENDPGAEAAASWRALCTEKAAADRSARAAKAAVQPGDVVTLPPGAWVDVSGTKETEFRAEFLRYRRGRRITEGTVFRGTATGRLVCLSGKTLAGLVITRPAVAGALANGSA